MHPISGDENIQNPLTQAQKAYAEFEHEMRLLETERNRMLEETIDEIDQERIKRLRKKMAANGYGG